MRELIPDDDSIQFSDHFVASGKAIFEAVKKLGLEGIVSKRAKAPYRSGPSRNWLKTKNYAEVELPILGIVQEAGNPTLALLGDTEGRTYIASASVVISKLNRDLFWQAVEFLTDPDKKRDDDNMQWLKPGLVGRVRYLWGSSGLRHATVHELLAGRRTSLTAEKVGMLSCGSQKSRVSLRWRQCLERPWLRWRTSNRDLRGDPCPPWQGSGVDQGASMLQSGLVEQ